MEKILLVRTNNDARQLNPADKRREYSVRRNSKTSHGHTTAVVDDERGHTSGEVSFSSSSSSSFSPAPWSGVLSVHLVQRVVRRCYQGHSERQLLVTPVHPQPSLPSSLRSANRGLRAGVHHHKWSHSNGNADLRKDAWWWWWLTHISLDTRQ